MITMAGMSHHTAPLHVRERLAIADATDGALARAHAALGPVAILSTCNRLELYVSGDHEPARLFDYLSAELSTDRDEIGRHFHIERGPAAVRHLYRVASGIDSMVIGESEILGQVRAAFSATIRAGVDDHVLSRLFHTAIRTGRRARSETAIGKLSLSVSSIAAHHARQLYPDLSVARVLVIGAGEAGRLAAESLVELNPREIVVTNRTEERAVALASALGAKSRPFDELAEAIANCDVVISSTGSPGTIVETEVVARAGANREGAPLLLIDIAVPRDFDPAVRDLPGVNYIDLDDLQAVAEQHGRMRRAEVEDVDALVEQETANFEQWFDHLQLVPTIAALTDHAERVRQREVARTQLRKTIERLDVGEAERDRLTEQLDTLTKAIVKQLLHDPIATLRERGDRDVYVDALRTLFRLDEPVRR